MRVLDLFCGAGGAAMGLHRAWPKAEIVGVDIVNQPRYPFQFRIANALHYPLEGFDFIWASPPCQGYSWSARRWKKQWPMLIEPVRERMNGTPYCIENVVGAPLHNPVKLCGQMFGLELIRHRLFECSFPVKAPTHPSCKGLVMAGRATSCIGHGDAGYKYRRAITVAGHGGESYTYKTQDWRRAMDIDWMTRDELAQAVPPAYSEYIARQYVRSL